jgi:hypothetical protein
MGGCMSKLGDNPLEVSREDEIITITIGVKELCHAVVHGLQYKYGDVTITQQILFTDDILRELTREEEDGTTLIHRMFDKAAAEAIENGSDYAEVE